MLQKSFSFQAPLKPFFHLIKNTAYYSVYSFIFHSRHRFADQLFSDRRRFFFRSRAAAAQLFLQRRFFLCPYLREAESLFRIVHLRWKCLQPISQGDETAGRPVLLGRYQQQPVACLHIPETGIQTSGPEYMVRKRV